MNTLEIHQSEIDNLCKLHQVQTLYAFGSVLTKNFNPKSDIDLLVDFKPIDVLDYVDNYYDLKFKLQELLNYPIDLLEEKAIKNPYFKEALAAQKQLLYG
jgi:predicted nucleotidyltransferase